MHSSVYVTVNLQTAGNPPAQSENNKEERASEKNTGTCNFHLGIVSITLGEPRETCFANVRKESKCGAGGRKKRRRQMGKIVTDRQGEGWKRTQEVHKRPRSRTLFCCERNLVERASCCGVWHSISPCDQTTGVWLITQSLCSPSDSIETKPPLGERDAVKDGTRICPTHCQGRGN